MSLASIIQNGVAIADGVTKSLQVSVQHYPFLGQDADGTETYQSTANVYHALVVEEEKPRLTLQGQMVLTRAYVMILEPMVDTTPNSGQQRTNPVDPRDKFILPDGTSGPIVEINTMINADTNAPYYVQIYLGRQGHMTSPG